MARGARGGVPEIPELQPEYRLVRELGRGGTAVVYLARDVELGRDVAIKLIRPTYVEDEDAVARLVREAQTVGKLQHPNIVMLLGTRRIANGGLALILQYVPGQNLKDRIRDAGPLAFDEVRHVLRNLGSALAYAHRARIVHRDIKPENVYLDESVGLARLADFGIARAWDSDSGLTLPGTALGTPSYMSPEQVDGRELDGRSDLYSLGVLGWEMLTGRQPWEGESLYSVIFKQKNEDLPPLRELRPDVPDDLLQVVEGAMRKRPEDRWRSADAFLAALDAGEAKRVEAAAAVPAPAVVVPAHVAAEPPEAEPELVDPEPPESEPVAASDRAPDAPAPLPDPGAAEEMADLPELPEAGAEVPAPEPPGARKLPPLRKPPPWAKPEVGEGAKGTEDLALAMAASSARSASTSSPGDDADRAWTLPGGARVSPGVMMVVAGGVLSLVLLSVGATLLIPSTSPEDRLPSSAGTWSTGPATGGVGAAGTRPSPGSGSAGVGASSAFDDGENALELAEGVPGFDPALSEVRRIAVLGGNAQSGNAGSTLEDPLVLRIVDGNGRAVEGARVTFEVLEGGGRVEPGVARSREDGIAAAAWTLGAGGVQRVQVGVDGGGGPQAIFTARLFGGSGQAGTGGGEGEDAASASDGSDFGSGSAPASGPRPISLGVQPAVLVGGQHTCALRPDGVLACWGANARGQLGDGTGRRVLLPLLAIQAGQFADMAVGVNHVCALTPDGAPYCWGANDQGQTGGAGASATTPRPVPGAPPFARISAGLGHSCALDGAGAAYCWGQNVNGQLGDGTNVGRAEPAAVATELRFGTIVAGWRHTCALDASGAAFCWGDGASGQLGAGAAVSATVPGAVAGGHRFRTLAAGGAHTCGLTPDGGILCWGSNAFGQLGTGGTSGASRPTPLASGGSFSRVVAGAEHGCALTSEGAAVCWGRNLYGQLGDGTTVDRRTPVPVRGGHRFSTLEARAYHTCGRNTAGVLLCWGRNDEGQLGDGTRQDRSEPVAAGGG